MSVRVRQRLPTIRDVVQRIEGARLRTLRSEFNSLHPFHLFKGSATLRCCALANCSRYHGARIGSPSFGSRGLTHDDASVLTKRSGLDSRREFQWAGGVTDEHGAVRRRRSEFNSRPACHFLLLTVL